MLTMQIVIIAVIECILFAENVKVRLRAMMSVELVFMRLMVALRMMKNAIGCIAESMRGNNMAEILGMLIVLIIIAVLMIKLDKEGDDNEM